MNNDMIEPYEKLQITEGALAKARAYSSLLCEKTNLECYGFLLNSKEERSLVVKDISLAFGQRVSSSKAEVTPDGVFESKAEIQNLGYDTIGCWHSHHHFGAFHSGIDDHNLEKLVNSLAGNREVIKEREVEQGIFLKKTSIIIKGKKREIKIEADKPMTFNISPKRFQPEIEYGQTKDNELFINIDNHTLIFPPNQYSLSIKPQNAERLVTVGITYSLVLSNRELYAEVATKTRCEICKDNQMQRKKIPIEVIKIPDDISFEQKELREHINQRIKSSYRVVKLFGK